MFERFTDQARRVMDLAQEESRLLSHSYLGTEHLLLGLIHEGDGVAAQALESLGVDLAAARQQVREIIGQGKPAPVTRTPFTPRVKRVLGLARREALAMGDSEIGPGHILLGLIREGEGVAADVLVRLGADPVRVRQQVIQLRYGLRDGDEPKRGQAAPRSGQALRRQRERPDILDLVASIDARLSALGRSLGTGAEVADLDQRIAQASRDKEAAAQAEDYESAAALRDTERQLCADKTARQQEWAAAHVDLASLAEELHRLRAEVGLLRDLLGEQDTGPDPAA
jgi:ATP-dependent Clp protease ATP-binding subunit ClpA